MYELIEEILPYENYLDNYELSKNPLAIDYLKKNPHRINFIGLSSNHAATELLKDNIDKICWNTLWLSKNPLMKELMTNNLAPHITFYKVSYKSNKNNLFKKQDSIKLLKNIPEEIYWNLNKISLSKKEAPIRLLKEFPEEIYWNDLSRNTTSIDVLKENLDKINWNYLSENKNPAAIEILKENPDKINWNILSKNPEAGELIKEKLLEKNVILRDIEEEEDEDDDNYITNKLNLFYLSSNPCIFEYSQILK